jgi:hypothetical protein
MIDLSPQPQDKASETADIAPGPRHDPAAAALPEEQERRASPFIFERAEAGIQLLSRWAGPLALAITLCLLGWWLMH